MNVTTVFDSISERLLVVGRHYQLYSAVRKMHPDNVTALILSLKYYTTK